jgi:hypothetical protein
MTRRKAKTKPIGTSTHKLRAGKNTITIWTDDALVGEVCFQSTCDTVVTRAFHGANNILNEEQMRPMAGGQIMAGPGRVDRPDACLLKLEPPEQFHKGLQTMFEVLAASAGTMLVSLYGSSSERPMQEIGEGSIPRKLQLQILRDKGYPAKRLNDIEVTVMLRARSKR